MVCFGSERDHAGRLAEQAGMWVALIGCFWIGKNEAFHGSHARSPSFTSGTLASCKHFVRLLGKDTPEILVSI